MDSLAGAEAHKNGEAHDVAALGQDNNNALQIIDEQQQFTQGLPAAMQDWGLYDQGFGYNVVAVFGSQSTGKSTLLNAVFGTPFDVMNESQRQQTTKGIWMAKGKKMPVLVMDVEGTDGRERGEDQDFERKSALFSLASSEVILLNLWEHQVGLWQGANLGLLKTVMEVNLNLFQASASSASTAASSATKQKTLLLFIIRDFIGATPLENLTTTLTQDLNRVWQGLSKPPGFEETTITDYFDLAFDALPHKLLQPDKFTSEVDRLRTRFNDNKVDDYVFKPLYHKRIPADGVAPYMAGIWDQVAHNKDLDLPTQQELLAQFRCDELASAAFGEFEIGLGKMQSILATALPPELGQAMTVARNDSLAKFDRDASRYHTGVYNKKRDELRSKMHGALLPIFTSQLKHIHKNLLNAFKANLTKEVKGSGESYDFAEVVSRLRSQTESKFVEAAGALLLAETDWNFEESLGLLREDMSAMADASRVEETKKMVTAIERTLKKQIAEPVELSLNKPSEQMWDRILSAFKEALDKAESAYTKKANSFNCTQEENAKALSALRRKAWMALRGKVDEQTSDASMLVKLRGFFEERFRYDEAGVPRVWKPTDDIDGLYKKAKDATLALIHLYANIKPSDSALAIEPPSTEDEELDPAEEDFDFSLVVFSESKQEDLANRFRREADAYYIEAKRSLVSSISQVPVWIYAVMAFLGWNEFVAVLRSPLYFTTLAILGAVAYVIWSLGMAGPVLHMAQAAYDQAVVSVNDKLRDHFSAQQNAPMAVPADTRRRSIDEDEGEGIELRRR